MDEITRARRPRWAGKVWTPRNKTRPTIITASPMEPPAIAVVLFGIAYTFAGQTAMREIEAARASAGCSGRHVRLRRRLLLVDIAVVDVADRNRPPSQG